MDPSIDIVSEDGSTKGDGPAHLLHCYHGSLNKFTVTSDGKVPSSNPHQVIKGEFQDKTTIGTNLTVGKKKLVLSN